MFWWGDGFYIDNNGNYFIDYDERLMFSFLYQLLSLLEMSIIFVSYGLYIAISKTFNMYVTIKASIININIIV